MTAREVNFDGLVGPTHNYGGLSFGNKASSGNAKADANPRLAAHQGIAKMRSLLDAGLIQGVLPPHSRPHGPTLDALGFGREPVAAVERLRSTAPELAPQVSSASAMWAANAATVAPSTDTVDGRVHLTAANLVANTNRSIEGQQTATTLRAIFANDAHFAVHEPLPATLAFGDEGAANHSRLANDHGEPGTHVFVYGRRADEPFNTTDGFPRRQTLQASEAVGRLHGIDADRQRFVRQSAIAIDAGAFHNDVVAVVNERVVLCHQDAYEAAELGSEPSIERVAQFVAGWSANTSVVPIVVGRDEVSLDEAVDSYLFNSQLITRPDGTMVVIAPSEAIETLATRAALDRITADGGNPIASVESFDLRQSMRNGGGPACLRLRVVLNDAERAALSGRVLVDHELLDELSEWVDRHYRSSITPTDLLDPVLADESMRALDELTSILALGSIYPFQV